MRGFNYTMQLFPLVSKSILLTNNPQRNQQQEEPQEQLQLPHIYTLDIGVNRPIAAMPPITLPSLSSSLSSNFSLPFPSNELPLPNKEMQIPYHTHKSKPDSPTQDQIGKPNRKRKKNHTKDFYRIFYRKLNASKEVLIAWNRYSSFYKIYCSSSPCILLVRGFCKGLYSYCCRCCGICMHVLLVYC